MATGRVPTTANSPLTAKGDLFGYSTTQARVAVGSDGDTLVADSAATTGLRWQGNYAAGKNAIINGDFRINQRSFSSSTTNGAFTFDRWFIDAQGGTPTFSAQTFTPGAAPVAGYEGTNFLRCVTSGQSGSNYSSITQRIEDVRTFAGQTITLSFWAKAGSGTPSVMTRFFQRFGSGGSSETITDTATAAITTSWARYSFTITLPSLSGKTIGTGSNVEVEIFFSFGSGAIGIQNNTFEIWGVQVEAGNVATAFQTATGTLQGELAACQRYFYRSDGSVGAFAFHGVGQATSSSAGGVTIVPPVPMRTNPSFTSNIGTGSFAVTQASGPIVAITGLSATYTGPLYALVDFSGASGLTAGHATRLLRNAGNPASTIDLSAEL